MLAMSETKKDERTRLNFDVPDRVRRAVNIVAAAEGVSIGMLIERIWEAHFPESLAQADKAIASGITVKPGRRKKE